ncbi:MAG: hypothetical protein D3923_10710, partial [Candidatus Electrothrix sp. AR3]|nr:hypothetical protein [Candidatus Electrothrix sp. AR3]
LFFFSASFQLKDAVAGSEYIFGVTIDAPWYDNDVEKNEIKDALASHTLKPTVRVVFDSCMYPVDKCVAACEKCWDPSDYQQPLENIASAAFIMGEILDSAYVKDYSVDEYIERTNEYLNRFEGIVDIWEIGNEVNGDWLGLTTDVVKKIEGAYKEVKNRGLVAALNLYYNKPCVDTDSEYEMFNWVNANISDDMKDELDYVFFSYYEDDCNGVVHTQEEWQAVFDALHLIFPNSKLGFGEVGTKQCSKKAQYMNRYYHQLDIQGDYFVGGYFWWYYKQDCVPKTKKLWRTLETGIIEKTRCSLPWLMLLL